MKKMFNDTMQGLMEAVDIEKGEIPLIEKKNMPAPTFVGKENRYFLLDVVVADDWKERKTKCDQLNKENKRRKQVISLIVTFLATHSMASMTVQYWGNYIEKNTLSILLWFVFIGLIAMLHWKGLATFIADIIDASVVKNGGIPIFKQIADTGAVLSYMICTYTSEIVYNGKSVKITCNVNRGKKIVQEEFIIEECRCDYGNVEKPTLYLQDLKVVLPADYRQRVV